MEFLHMIEEFSINFLLHIQSPDSFIKAKFPLSKYCLKIKKRQINFEKRTSLS